MALPAAGAGVAGSAAFRSNGDNDDELQTAAAVAAYDAVTPPPSPRIGKPRA